MQTSCHFTCAQYILYKGVTDTDVIKDVQIHGMQIDRIFVSEECWWN